MDRYSLIALFSAAALAAGGASAAPNLAPKEAEPATVAANEKLLSELPFANRQDFEDARRGFVATIPNGEVKAPDGRVIWSMEGFKFLEKDRAPATVNPSLWRQAQVNQIHGLFKVTDRVYQVRSLDLSNMTIIEGDTGLIIVDPLLSMQTAKAALDLYLQHRPRKPVVAVIYTHSHADHFGGVRGVVDEADVKAGKVKILAPAGFTDHAVSENVIAGNAMSRRAQYMYGVFLPPGEKSLVDTGSGPDGLEGKRHADPAHRHDRQGRGPARRRRRRDGVPAHARHRSAVRNEHLLPAVQDAQRCGERDAQHAQPVHAAGRGDPRRDRVVAVTSSRRANSSPTSQT